MYTAADVGFNARVTRAMQIVADAKSEQPNRALHAFASDRIRMIKTPITLENGVEQDNSRFRLLDHFNKNRASIALAPRQAFGKTTTSLIYAAYWAFTNPGKTILYFAPTLRNCDLGRELFTKFIGKENIRSYVRNDVTMWNGSKIQFISAFAPATRFCGITPSLVIFDEWNTSFKEPMESLVVFRDCKTFIVSSLNPYIAQLWEDSVAGKTGLTPEYFHWSEIPGYNMTWRKEQIKNLGLSKFLEEYEGQMFSERYRK